VAGFKNHKAVIDAHLEGRYSINTWRKTPSQTTAANIWFDLSMSPGNPNPQYYAAAPMVSKALSLSQDGGIYHGPAVSPYTKFLQKFMALTVTATAVPLPMILLDYLLYYPFIDMSSTDLQPMTVGDALPRYTDGDGVQIMAVEVAAQVGGSTFFVNYTNSDGVPGRQTPTVTCNTQVTTGTIITSAAATLGSAGPFLPLQAGDSGVRSIESITFLTGDVGLITLVLVKPLASLSIFDITAPAERDFILDGPQCPVIKDDAYLNAIVLPSGTLAAAPLHGTIETIWN
jgi:hypothetical protein